MTPKDWHNLSASGSVRSWTRNSVAASPFHAGRVAPIRKLLGCDVLERICIDVAHTYAIAGYGKDELASTLVLLAVHCKVWGAAGAYEHQLQCAYESFSSWCSRRGKTTTILDFSKKELKILSLLDFVLRKIVLDGFGKIGIAACVLTTPRLQHFPRGLGKGSDAALVGAWLGDIMAAMDESMVPATCLRLCVRT